MQPASDARPVFWRTASISLTAKKCKYLLKEEIRGEVPFPNFEENGKRYWISCNCDQISFDAAAAIEELVECISDLIAQAL